MINNQEINFTNKITFDKDIEIGKDIELFEAGTTNVTIVSQEAKAINNMVFFTVAVKSTSQNAWQQLLKFKEEKYRPVKVEAVSLIDSGTGTHKGGVMAITGIVQNIGTLSANATYYITGFYFIK